MSRHRHNPASTVDHCRHPSNMIDVEWDSVSSKSLTQIYFLVTEMILQPEERRRGELGRVLERERPATALGKARDAGRVDHARVHRVRADLRILWGAHPVRVVSDNARSGGAVPRAKISMSLLTLCLLTQ